MDMAVINLEKLRRGNALALGQIYDLYASQIYRHAHRILLDRASAEDVTHDIFVRLPELLQSFREESSLSTWLFRITHNCCLERLRRENNRRQLLAQSVENQEFSLLNRLGNSEHLDILHRLLALVDEETRSLLWLKDGEGYEIQELSRVFQQPEGTLKSKLHRARELMKSKLQKWEEKDGTANIVFGR